jgi:hypothetical protein
MENTLIYIVIASLALNAILVVAVLIFVYKLIQKSSMMNIVQDQLKTVSDDYLSSGVKQEDKRFIQQEVETVTHAPSIGDYCVDHSTEISIGNCAISSNAYCKHCLKSFQSIRVGKKYLNMYLAHEWKDFLILEKKNSYEEVPTYLLDIKNEIWQSEEIPVIVQNHYKINIQDDSIESFTVFQCRDEDLDNLKIRFNRSTHVD